MEEFICFVAVVVGMILVGGMVSALKDNTTQHKWTDDSIKQTLAGIINPEVLGLETTEVKEAEEPAAELWGDAASGSVLDQPCPKCRKGYIREWEGQYRCWNCGHVMQDHEEMERLGVEAEPPVLHPKSDMLGDPSGPALRYRRRDGTSGVIFFAKDSVEIIGNRVNLSPQGGFERYAIALDQVLNPEVLEPAAPDVPEGELPPMLEPQGIYVGDVTGKEMRYSRRDGSTGTIYFDPDTVEIVDSTLYLRGRVVLSPQGRPERYSIALDQVHNPEALFEVPEPPPLLMPEPEPEWEPAQFRPGIRVVIDEVPLDSYEAVQVMRRIKPELGSFEIIEALSNDPKTLLQGYPEHRAKDILEDLQTAGCTGWLVTVGTNTDTAIAEPPPEPKIIEEPEPTVAEPEPQPLPPVLEPAPTTGRPPTEEEFFAIRHASEEKFDAIEQLIVSAPIDVNARDKHGDPLVFGVQSTRMLGLLMDRGADIHATNGYQLNALHYTIHTPDVCEMLIQFGIDIDAMSELGRTPLIRAAMVGEYKIAKMLIEHGADIHVKPEHGETALHAAQHNIWEDDPQHQDSAKRCKRIAKLLRRHGAN